MILQSVLVDFYLGEFQVVYPELGLFLPLMVLKKPFGFS
jgi:hypothetical protein